VTEITSGQSVPSLQYDFAAITLGTERGLKRGKVANRQ
jgi:hypothetical protein